MQLRVSNPKNNSLNELKWIPRTVLLEYKENPQGRAALNLNCHPEEGNAVKAWKAAAHGRQTAIRREV